jgi:exodeoxyribonuclease-3
MRLITWNCKGAFHRKHPFVAALRPDVLIVPECEKLPGIAQLLDSKPVRSFEWFGSNPRKGLAVVSYGDYALTVHPDYDPRHQWIAPLSVSGPLPFVLFAVWTLPLGQRGGRYVRPLFEAFDSYGSLIQDSQVVWAGDFNASFVFDTPSRKYKFRDFVALLSRTGLHSLYHLHHMCDHGEEPDETFFLHHRADRGFHIDYVFASDGLHPDGMDVPVICDIPG